MTDGVGNAGLVALIAIVPIVVLMLTSFVKVSVVLSLLRNAIGATDAPSGLVVMGLSLILTFFVMAPVAVQMVTAAATQPANAPAPKGAPAPDSPPATNAPTNGTTNAPATSAPSSSTANPPAPSSSSEAPASSTPSSAQPIDVLASLRAIVPVERRDDVDAVARAIEPLKAFLAKHAAERDKATFVALGDKLGQKRTADELAVLAPAFVTTELREAFAIAVLIFIPFLVIDLLVGLGLASLGLSTTSPQTVALPIKLLLCVAVDGWRLLIDSLLRGYA